MIKKKYKILEDSFKQYILISKNTFAKTKINKILSKSGLLFGNGSDGRYRTTLGCHYECFRR